MKVRLSVAGLLALGLAFQLPAASSEASDEPTAEADPPAPGSIRGTVEVRTPPPRRTADRYARGRSRGPEKVQPIPAVAYLKGSVPGPAAGSGGPPAMAQQDTTFNPAALVVPVGGTVEFPNRDPFFHNVFSYSSAGRFDLGRYPQGESKSVTFEEPGIIRVYCEVHESMRAAIVVSPNPYHAVVGDDGSFTISDVPPGTWELEVWHPDVDPRALEVRVPDGGVARVDVELR
jgi:plastocyanin